MQWQGYGCAELPARYRVLRGQDCVEDGHSNFRAAAIGLEKHGRRDIARKAALDGLGEEEPGTGALHGALDYAWDAQITACSGDGQGVCAPCGLREGNDGEPRPFIRPQRIYGGGKRPAVLLAEKMAEKDLVRQRGEAPVRTYGAPRPPHVAKGGFPAMQADGGIADAPRCRALIPARVDIRPSAEKGAEKPDLLFRRRIIVDHVVASFRREAPCRPQLPLHQYKAFLFANFHDFFKASFGIIAA